MSSLAKARTKSALLIAALFLKGIEAFWERNKEQK
jgi:hypothetical protein